MGAKSFIYNELGEDKTFLTLVSKLATSSNSLFGADGREGGRSGGEAGRKGANFKTKVKKSGHEVVIYCH